MADIHIPAVGDPVVITDAQSYEMTWDEDDDRIVDMEGTLVSVDTDGIEENRANSNLDRAPYEVRTADGETVWAADVRLIDDAYRAEQAAATAESERRELERLRRFHNSVKDLTYSGSLPQNVEQQLRELLYKA